jgi:hypothetical protein
VDSGERMYVVGASQQVKRRPFPVNRFHLMLYGVNFTVTVKITVTGDIFRLPFPFKDQRILLIVTISFLSIFGICLCDEPNGELRTRNFWSCLLLPPGDTWSCNSVVTGKMDMMDTLFYIAWCMVLKRQR